MRLYSNSHAVTKSTHWCLVMRPFQQPRQLRYVRRNAPRLIRPVHECHGHGNLPSGHNNKMIRIAATTAKVIATAIVVCRRISTSLVPATGSTRVLCRLPPIIAPNPTRRLASLWSSTVQGGGKRRSGGRTPVIRLFLVIQITDSSYQGV